LLRLLDFEAFNAGSAVPTLNRNHIHNLPTLLPPAELIRAFDEVAMQLLCRQHVAEKESVVLSALRDTLLPKLISGEIRVKDAEKLAEAVA
jgi:type I restriction enzyme S subunit